MRYSYLIPLAALTVAVRSVRALDTNTGNATHIANSAAMAKTAGAGTMSLTAVTSVAIPPWARKYNMNCSGCHYPTVPRLNATGLAFKWAGYRMESDFGKAAEVKNVADYIGVRGVIQYGYTKTQNAPADTNTLYLPSASLFVGGSLGKNYGMFLEFERTPDAAVDLIGMFTGVWGNQTGFGGIRAGQGHMIIGGGVAGFDRPTGILAPLPLEEQATPGVPFSFTGDVAGAEAFYVFSGRNRTSVGYVNGLAPGGEGMDVATNLTRHDWVVTDQFMWDDFGVSLGVIGYFGTVAGLDTAQSSLRSKYQRWGFTGNKFIGPFEAQAGYVYSHNSSLPTGGPDAMFPSANVNGNGYWIYGGYAAKPTYLTFYGRYETLDPNTSVSDDATHRIVLGGLLPVNVPEYLRLGLEYFLTTPQLSGAPKRQGITAQVHVAF